MCCPDARKRVFGEGSGYAALFSAHSPRATRDLGENCGEAIAREKHDRVVGLPVDDECFSTAK